MAAIITTKHRIKVAKNLYDSLATLSYYLFIGKVSEWDDEANPPIPENTDDVERLVWEDMIGGKKITQANSSHVIRRINWASNTVYDRYDDQDEDLHVSKDFYVITDEYNVYKCIDNDLGAQSTEKPTGTSSSIITLADNYKWKYMYTVSTSDALAFLIDDWMPVKFLESDDGSDQWTVQETAIDGGIHAIEITDGGTGYDSVPTVTITGDGTGAAGTATLDSGVVTKITITDPGSGYTEATVSFSGGTPEGDAVARVIYSTPEGHGANPLEELGAYYVLIGAELDEEESGELPVTNDFRKVGVMINPKIYGTDSELSDTVFNQTKQLELITVSGTFAPDDDVTGDTSGATAKVVRFDSVNDILYINEISGTFQTESITSGANTAVIDTITDEDVEPRSGDLIYIENRQSINRAADQKEKIKIILEF